MHESIFFGHNFFPFNLFKLQSRSGFTRLRAVLIQLCHLKNGNRFKTDQTAGCRSSTFHNDWEFVEVRYPTGPCRRWALTHGIHVAHSYELGARGGFPQSGAREF